MKVRLMLIAMSLSFSCSSFAEEHVVEQQNKEFTVKDLTIKSGDVVKFVNKDDFFHNVFSLSDAKFFDLGSFPKNESKSVTFDEPGVVEVECAVHPDMIMKITVE